MKPLGSGKYRLATLQPDLSLSHKLQGPRIENVLGLQHAR